METNCNIEVQEPLIHTETEKQDLFKQSFKFYRNQASKRCHSDKIFDSFQLDQFTNSNEFERLIYTGNHEPKDLVNGCRLIDNVDANSTNIPTSSTGTSYDDVTNGQPHSNCSLPLPLGLNQPSTWKMFRFKFPEGLLFIENPFTPEGQRYWISKCMFDYPKKPHITNIDNLAAVSGQKSDSLVIDEKDTSNFYKKLRWITFGYHHNWDTKIYSESSKCDFPSDLNHLTKYISHILGFENFEAEAAIVNYYHLDSTLSGHQDRSERYQEAPLFSISFGQTALFLVGGNDKSVEPVPIYLRSGDIVVMAGKSRLSYHGVPRIIQTPTSPWLSSSSSNRILLASEEQTDINECPVPKRAKYEKSSETLDTTSSSSIHTEQEFRSVLNNWNDFLSDYISRCRINLNVRQVLFPGESSLAS